MLQQGLANEVNTPLTSSAGRAFDAVAAIAGLRQEAGFEGHAAMELEFALPQGRIPDAYTLALPDAEAATGLGWGPLLDALIDDVRRNTPIAVISARFHNALVDAIVAVARRGAAENVLLTGGCFQNAYLTESASRRLAAEGFRPLRHRDVPPNDGGLAFGQLVAAMRGVKEEHDVPGHTG